MVAKNNNRGIIRPKKPTQNRTISRPQPLPSRKKIKQRRNKRQTNKKRIIVLIIGLCVALFAAVGLTAFQLKNSVDKTHVQNALGSKSTKTFNDGKPFTVLLLGADTGDLGRDYRGRTDSIMLATVNKEKKTVKLTSIPRDTVVAIKGHEDTFPQKLNAAYTFGSIKTVTKTVEGLFNIPIDAYALVNMKGLIKTVDTVGGVQVKSPLTFNFSPESAHESGQTMYRFHKGSSVYQVSKDAGETWTEKDKMDGEAALSFVRMRYEDPQGDYGRVQRQRILLTAILKEAKNANNILNTDFMDSLSGSVQTSISFNELVTIAKDYRPALQTIKSDHVQGVSEEYNGVDYEYITTKERQRVTNTIRSSLGLKHATTGSQFSGKPSIDLSEDFLQNAQLAQ